MDDVLKKLQPILPIRLEQTELQIVIPATFAHQSFNILKKYGTIKNDSWGSDGSLSAVIEMPAGLREEFLDKLNALTHGGVDMKVIR